jgi:hypothetical protein
MEWANFMKELDALLFGIVHVLVNAGGSSKVEHTTLLLIPDSVENPCLSVTVTSETYPSQRIILLEVDYMASSSVPIGSS